MSAKTAEVLSEVMKERDLSQTDLAKAVGVTPQAVQQWCSGKTVPRGDKLVRLAEYLSLSPAVLQFGTDGATGRLKPTTVEQGELVSIPQFDVAGECGRCGADNGNPSMRPIVAMLQVTRSWLAAKGAVASIRHLEVITAHGDSMAPTVNDLDFVFVDRSYDCVTDDGVYVVSYARGTYIKRIQSQPNGDLLLISDNKKYPPIRVDASESHNIAIDGKCVIACPVVLL